MPRAGHPADPDKAGTAGQSARGDLRGFASWPLGCCHAGAPSRRPPSELCARTCPHSRRRTSAVGPRRRASRPDGRSRGHRQPAVEDRFTRGFADAAIDELGRLIDELPAKIKDSVSGGRDAAEALSTDPLQGIAEIVQNADDQLASTVTITWDAETPALLIAHDGTRLHLADLVAMVLPWVSTKRGDNRSTGRFGIGLNTLRTIGDGLHIHCHPYHATLKGGRLTVAAPLMSHLDEEDRPQTVLRIPLAADADLQPDDIRAWLQQWGSAALLFLRSVRTVRLLGPDGDIDVELSLWRRPRRRRRLAVGGTYFKVDITEVVDGSGDGRWLRYEAELPSPAGVTRAKKSTGPTTPVSVAVPTGTTTGGGALHAGLPVVRTALPWSLNAQLDPDTARGHVRDTRWNRALLRIAVDFWAAVAGDVLRTRPALGWRAVPLDEEVRCPQDPWLEAELREALLTRARPELARIAEVRVGASSVPLKNLGYADPLLQDLLTDDDLQRLAHGRTVLPRAALGDGQRWSSVLGELGVSSPVGIRDVLSLTADRHLGRDAAWYVAVAARALAAGAAEDLKQTACVVLADGRRVVPPAVGTSPVLLTADVNPASAAVRAGLVRALDPAYASASTDAGAVTQWLAGIGAFSAAPPTPDDVVARLAEAGSAALRVDDGVLTALRDLFELLPHDAHEAYGRRVGAAVVLDAECRDATGRVLRDRRAAIECYQHRRIDRDSDTWAAAAADTPHVWWVAGRYADVLRHPAGRGALGAQKFLTLLGVERAPRLLPHPDGEQKYDGRRGVRVWHQASPATRKEELSHTPDGRTHVLQDLVCPDLERVVADIRADANRTRRRRRAAALLATLQRSWDRAYAERAQVQVVSAYHQWNFFGVTVTAWWLARLRDEPWLPDADGRLCAPRDLVLPSAANRAVYGDAGHYADGALVLDLRDDLVRALGITGDPRVSDVLTTLQQVRDAHPNVASADDRDDWETAAAATYPMYGILADWLSATKRRRMDVPADHVRQAFSTGRGLVLTDHGWRRPHDVLSGPPVFGTLRPFAPYQRQLQPLWSELRIRRPGLADCADVLRDLSRRKRRSEDEAVELETLRMLDRLLDTIPAPPGLRRLPIRTPNGPTGRRPVYAVDDPDLRAALEDHVAVWEPGGDPRQFARLLPALGITAVRPDDVAAADDAYAAADPARSALARSALSLLLDELVRDDPALAASADRAADLARDLSVLIHDDLHVIALLAGHGPVQVPTRAHLDRSRAVLHVQQGEHAGDWQVGGRAVAALFAEDRQKVAYAWAAMWARAEGGSASAPCASLRSRPPPGRRPSCRSTTTSRPASTSSHRRRSSAGG